MGTHKFHDFGFKSDFGYMGLAPSNISEPPVFLDRIAISEILIKSKYFYFEKPQTFIYENLLKIWKKRRLFFQICVPRVTLPFNIPEHLKIILETVFWGL